MSVRTVVVWPDPRLKEKTQSITSFDDETRSLYRDLVDTMHAYNGIGIASVQIGVPKQVFLLEAELCGDKKDAKPWAFINPEILSVSEEKDKEEEGCLSFPGIYIPIERPTGVRVRAQNLDGETFEIGGEGLLARAIQHEYDHITGKVMTDFVGPLKRTMIKKKLKKEQLS